ncbi:MAG: type II toxin-antitoxin system YafQ family toxin [Halothiobacillus sp.]
MRSASYTGQFKRDVKLAEKRGKDLSKLRVVISLLLDQQPLPRELADHPLKGEWKPSRDLHIEPDWILIYRIVDDAVQFERTGSHSDLFEH